MPLDHRRPHFGHTAHGTTINLETERRLQILRNSSGVLRRKELQVSSWGGRKTHSVRQKQDVQILSSRSVPLSSFPGSYPVPER